MVNIVKMTNSALPIKVIVVGLAGVQHFRVSGAYIAVTERMVAGGLISKRSRS